MIAVAVTALEAVAVPVAIPKITVIAVPVAIVAPLMAVATPIAVVLVPATLAFAVQVAAPVARLVAVVATVLDGISQPVLRPFNAKLAASSVFRLRARRRGKKAERSESCGQGHSFSEVCKTEFCVQGFSSRSPPTLIKMRAPVFRATERELRPCKVLLKI